MDGRHYHNLTWVPMFLIGIITLIVGSIYYLNSEPWLLDKSANEILLGADYSMLFSQNTNLNLSLYLLFLYRFFGLSLFSVGLLIIIFVIITKMGTSLSQNLIQSVTLIVVLCVYRTVSLFIPSSPFIFLNHIIFILLVISVFGSIKLKKYK